MCVSMLSHVCAPKSAALAASIVSLMPLVSQFHGLVHLFILGFPSVVIRSSFQSRSTLAGFPLVVGTCTGALLSVKASTVALRSHNPLASDLSFIFPLCLLAGILLCLLPYLSRPAGAIAPFITSFSGIMTCGAFAPSKTCGLPSPSIGVRIFNTVLAELEFSALPASVQPRPTGVAPPSPLAH